MCINTSNSLFTLTQFIEQGFVLINKKFEARLAARAQGTGEEEENPSGNLKGDMLSGGFVLCVTVLATLCSALSQALLENPIGSILSALFDPIFVCLCAMYCSCCYSSANSTLDDEGSREKKEEEEEFLVEGMLKAAAKSQAVMQHRHKATTSDTIGNSTPSVALSSISSPSAAAPSTSAAVSLESKEPITMKVLFNKFNNSLTRSVQDAKLELWNKAWENANCIEAFWMYVIWTVGLMRDSILPVQPVMPIYTHFHMITSEAFWTEFPTLKKEEWRHTIAGTSACHRLRVVETVASVFLVIVPIIFSFFALVYALHFDLNQVTKIKTQHF